MTTRPSLLHMCHVTQSIDRHALPLHRMHNAFTGTIHSNRKLVTVSRLHRSIEQNNSLIEFHTFVVAYTFRFTIQMSTFIRHIGRNTRDTQKTVHKYTKTKYTKKTKQKNNQSVSSLKAAHMNTFIRHKTDRKVKTVTQL